MSNIAHDAIMAGYEKRRAAARQSLYERREAVYTELPEIRSIDERMAKTGLEYNMGILKGSPTGISSAVRLQNELEQLISQKRRLLESCGYSSDYLETAYTCEHCKDTGYISTASGSAKCRCYLQQMVDMLFEQSNLKLARNCSFRYFDEEMYANAANEAKYGIKLSPRGNIRMIKKRCLDFIANFPKTEGKNLFFSGPAGTGKTFMCNCIAVELINQGHTVLYQTSPSLFSTIAEYKQRSYKEGYADVSDESPYRQIFEVGLLIIDDLGTEPPSASRYAELLTILDTRHLNNNVKPCRTIISTNIGTKELYEYYDERNASRIISGFDMLKFAGDDIRMICR